ETAADEERYEEGAENELDGCWKQRRRCFRVQARRRVGLGGGGRCLGVAPAVVSSERVVEERVPGAKARSLSPAFSELQPTCVDRSRTGEAFTGSAAVRP